MKYKHVIDKSATQFCKDTVKNLYCKEGLPGHSCLSECFFFH